MFEIEALSAFEDNYIWLIKNKQTQQCAVVDPGDATPVLEWLNQHTSWQLTDILITHHHADHTSGIRILKAQTKAIVSAPNNPTSIPSIDRPLSHNQLITIVGRTLQVLHVPGHTLDHLAYYSPNNIRQNDEWLFCGDTLFAGGCGRVFEGTMEQMYHSLQQLANLPAETLIYPAHEYTVSNLRFALAVEPNNHLIQQRLNQSIRLREQQKITLPSTLAEELQTNPFLRCYLPNIKSIAEKYAGHSLSSEAEVFTILREWKNNF